MYRSSGNIIANRQTHTQTYSLQYFTYLIDTCSGFIRRGSGQRFC